MTIKQKINQNWKCLLVPLVECAKFSIDALPFSQHLHISVDVKLFVHDRITSIFQNKLLVGFMLLDLQFYMYVLQIVVLLYFFLCHCVVRYSSIWYLQTLPTFPKHLSSTPVFVGFMVLDRQFSVQCFVDHCFCFSFVYCVFCPQIYGF